MNNTGKPKTCPASFTGFKCRACNQPRPKASTLWCLPFEGGPGLEEQRKLDKALAKKHKKNLSPEASKEPATQAPADKEATNKPGQQAQAKAARKAATQHSFALSREGLGILSSLGLHKTQKQEKDEELALEAANAKADQDEADMADDTASTELFTRINEAAAPLLQLVASLGTSAKQKGLKNALNFLKELTTSTSDSPSTIVPPTQEAPAVTKNRKASTLAQEKAILQKDLATILQQQEHNKSARDSQVKQKEELMARHQEEYANLLTDYQTEREMSAAALATVNQGLQQVELLLQEQLPETFDAFADALPAAKASKETGATPHRRWSTLAAAPLESFRSQEGFAAFKTLFAACRDSPINAEETFYRFLDGVKNQAVAPTEHIAKRKCHGSASTDLSGGHALTAAASTPAAGCMFNGTDAVATAIAGGTAAATPSCFEAPHVFGAPAREGPIALSAAPSTRSLPTQRSRSLGASPSHSPFLASGSESPGSSMGGRAGRKTGRRTNRR